MSLSPKQQRFVAEYLIDSNATQAAIRAGYSKKTAKAIGCENLTKPDVAAAVEKGRAKIAGKLGITAESLVRDVADIGKEARDDGAFPAALKACEMLGKSLGKENPFSETLKIDATVENKPASLPDLARELAFLLASGVQAIEADDPPLH